MINLMQQGLEVQQSIADSNKAKHKSYFERNESTEEDETFEEISRCKLFVMMDEYGLKNSDFG